MRNVRVHGSAGYIDSTYLSYPMFFLFNIDSFDPRLVDLLETGIQQCTLNNSNFTS